MELSQYCHIFAFGSVCLNILGLWFVKARLERNLKTKMVKDMATMGANLLLVTAEAHGEMTRRDNASQNGSRGPSGTMN
jgi:hypothetical protein